MTLICSSTTGIRLANPLCSRTSRVSSSIWDFITAWAISWFFSFFRAVDLQVTTTPANDSPPVIRATMIASVISAHLAFHLRSQTMRRGSAPFDYSTKQGGDCKGYYTSPCRRSFYMDPPARAGGSNRRTAYHGGQSHSKQWIEFALRQYSSSARTTFATGDTHDLRINLCSR